MFNAPGVGFFASSGDTAFKVLYPSSSPEVVAVGGTELVQDGNTARPGGWDEGAWWNAEDNGDVTETGGGGSGCSTWAPKPAWQAAVLLSSICANRATADVSADADPNSGVAVYQTPVGQTTGGWSTIGGTSAAAPIIAATYALAGDPGTGSSAAIRPYSVPGSLNDVTKLQNAYPCANLLCKAGPGWDGPTGLGTPNGLGGFTADGFVHTVPAQASIAIATVPAQRSFTGRAIGLQVNAQSSSATDTLSYTSSGLPRGLVIDPTTGVISGVPSAAGTFHPVVSVFGASGAGSSQAFTWTITPACSTGVLKVLVGKHTLTGHGRTRTATLSRTVHVRGGCHATLTFTINVSGKETARTAKDTLVITVNGHVIKRLSNRNRGNHAVRVSLSAYAGRNVVIKFVSRESVTRITVFKIGSTRITFTQ